MTQEQAKPRVTAEIGLNDHHLRQYVIVPTLDYLGHNSDAAVQLLLNTARHESHLMYLVQLRNGPARGLWQMEPATHDDIWQHFLISKPDLHARLLRLSIGSREGGGHPDAQQMVGNLFYACAMARVHYLRVPEPLPAVHDLHGQARYWKRYYNTHLGAGTEEQFIATAREGTEPKRDLA